MPLYKINIYAFFLIGFLNPLARAEGTFFRYVCLFIIRFLNHLARAAGKCFEYNISLFLIRFLNHLATEALT